MTTLSPRPHRRGRIETRARAAHGRSSGPFPPGLTAGGGLKQRNLRRGCGGSALSPRPHRRGRIETVRRDHAPIARTLSPGLTAGGGLKPSTGTRSAAGRAVPPGLTAGGGLKPASPAAARPPPPFPPGLTAGGGLKLRWRRGGSAWVRRFPRPHRRGRIETGILPAVQMSRPRFPRPHRRGRIETSFCDAGDGHDRAFPPASPPGAD